MSHNEFLDFLYGEETGYVTVVTKGIESGQPDQQRWFMLPDSRDYIPTYISMRTNIDVWASVSIYSSNERDSSDPAAKTTVLYADADYCEPKNFRLEPSLIVQSSPGRYQCYWKLDETVSADVASELSHKIAAAHQHQGCDISGWIKTKILRVPGTTNTKHGTDEVTSTYTGTVYSVAEVEKVYSDTSVHRVEENFGDAPALLDRDVVEEKLIGYPTLSHLYGKVVRAGESSSDHTHRLACDLYRTGNFTDQEVHTIVWFAKANKFRPDSEVEFTQSGTKVDKRRANPQRDSWHHIQAAKQSVGQGENVVIELDVAEVLDEAEDTSFVSATEREFVDSNITFIDRFVDWVDTRSPLSDKRLRRTSAFMLLSNVFGDKGYIIPQFGPVWPNLWIISIGETSTSKKTTIMNLHNEVLKACEANGIDNPFLTNSFSQEALNKALGERDGLLSLVVQDEIQGKFQEWNTKQYLTGIKDFLNGLYNGHVETAIRQNKDSGQSKKGVRTVFNFYAMGTPREIGNALTIEDFQSGFLMRWLIGYADKATLVKEENRLKLRSRDEVENYSRSGSIDPVPAEFAKQFRRSVINLKKINPSQLIDFTEEAFARFTQWEDMMFDRAAHNEDNRLLRPVIDRLKINAMKACALLAMSEGRRDVILSDVLTVLVQCEYWYEDMQKLISSVSASAYQIQCNEIEGYISVRASRSRANLLRRFSNYRIREVDEMLESLVQQGRITISKSATGGISYKAVQ